MTGPPTRLTVSLFEERDNEINHSKRNRHGNFLKIQSK